MFEKSGGDISRKNNKGVLDRPWTKRRVLRAISSTLKCQFTGNQEMKRFDYSVRQKLGDPGPIKLRNVFPLISVLSKPLQLLYGTNKSVFGQFFGFPNLSQFAIWQCPTRKLIFV